MISKKVTVIVAVVAFLLSGALSFAYFRGGLKSIGLAGVKDVTIPSLDQASEGPKTEECPMNGQLMTEGQRKRWEARRPMGVMVENHTEARPQSGLSNADVVYEAVAEGGITRFLNIFYCDDAKIIGPVRSARIYYVKLLQGYGAYPLYAHVGGANTPGPADALGEIDELGWGGYSDLNQFSVPFPIYYRDYDRLPDRATEHTMYASTDKLWNYAKTSRDLTEKDKDGERWDEGFEPWKFKDDAKESERGNTNSIKFDFWGNFGNDFGVTWAYDKANNIYKRSNGGAPHVDKNTGQALTAKSVVVAMVDESPANDGYPGGHLLYDVVGEGQAYVFQDGKVIRGTWSKGDEEEMMRFFDGSGNEVELTRGKIWVEILPTGNKVTF